MTLNNLKDEMSALGFEREIALDKNLVFAIKRALSTIYTERSVYNEFSIEHHPIMPTLICKSMTHTAGSSESFTINGKAYSFSISGSGSFAVEEGNVRKEYSFSSPLYLFRGFISNEAKITFFGEFSFEIFNLAVFESIRSKNEEDLFSYGDPFEYKIDELKNDFHSFVSLPTDSSGKEISGSVVRTNRLIIPWGYKGKINLIYKVKAPAVNINTPDAEIDAVPEIEHLIPLLSAAYYWADDAPDKAEYYLALYRDAMKAVKEFNTRRLANNYNDVTRWA